MLAKKAVPEAKKVITRDKDAKISSIVDATLKIIVSMGYEKMTIRDIAETADVSVGLIYKYFPGGKFDILVKGLGAQQMDILLSLKQPEVDFNDFPGYMRKVIAGMFYGLKENSGVIKALMAATLLEGDISKDLKNLDITDYSPISKFFTSFKGVDIKGQDPVKLLLYWGIVVKGSIISIMMFPISPEDESAMIDILVDQSLRIWGYRETG